MQEIVTIVKPATLLRWIQKSKKSGENMPQFAEEGPARRKRSES